MQDQRGILAADEPDVFHVLPVGLRQGYPRSRAAFSAPERFTPWRRTGWGVAG